MKKFKNVVSYVDENINVGDNVKIFDGSGLASISHPDTAFYIVDSYPDEVGSYANIKHITGEVISTDIKDVVSWEQYNNSGRCYRLDIEVQIGNARFLTCSKFVRKVVD